MGHTETDFSDQTALQVYCQAYKQAAVGQAHGLLRKARRLDQVLNIRTDAVVIPPERSPPLDRECHYCRCQFSPAFYPMPRYSGQPLLDGQNGHRSPETEPTGWECHKCYFKRLERDREGNLWGDQQQLGL